MEAIAQGSEIGVNTDQHLRQSKRLVRFITCGSVDDGKSTLIGRLLYDSNRLFQDQLTTLHADSQKFGSRADELDYALLVDGLAAEREQGITIDVAYRFFTTERRNFIAADSPGHEQYTRNMITAASTADLAVVLIDARKGVLTQTRRHSYLVSLIGIRHVVLAITKMDLVGYAQDVFVGIEQDYRKFARQIGLENVVAIPVSGVNGDNIVARSSRTPWFCGLALLEHLEALETDETQLQGPPFRFPVQWVNRPSPDFRGFTGTIVSGAVRRGDRICVQPSGRESRVARIVAGGGDRESAVANESITLTLADDIDVSRGDLISAVDAPAEVAHQFEATVIWMSEHPMLPGRSYLLKLNAMTVGATIAPLKYRISVDTLEHVAATKLDLNEIGVVNLQLDRAIAFAPYLVNRDLGGFILVDRISNNTLGAGLLRFALRRAHNVPWQAIEVRKTERAALLAQRPCLLWFTGLSGAGKSTIANLVEKRLHALGLHTYLLDGDNVRHGLNRDLGFTDADRVENIRRVAEVAKLMVDAGLIVISAFISPFRNERQMARGLLQHGEFVEIFVDTPIALAEKRDPKGLYKKARTGQLKNFTGIDSPYEKPDCAEIVLRTTECTPEAAAEIIVEYLQQRRLLEL